MRKIEIGAVAPNHHDSRLLAVQVDCMEGMSGSTARSAYDPLPVNAPPVRSSEEQHPQRESPRLLRHWRWEIFTFALGTGAFASIFALLVQFRDKPPPTLPLGNEHIQLTAIIAALAQVAQSAFLVPISYCIGQLKWEWFQRSNRIVDLDRFDLASRGPDGSIRLLFHFSWRQRLVSLGALATILMLLFPTFVQQSVRVGEKEFVLHDTDSATIARSVNIFTNPKRKATLATVAGNGTISSYEIDMDLSTALRSGATGYSTAGSVYAGSDSGVSGHCGGGYDGECSWSPFNTLALCSSVSNISHEITLDEDHVTLPALSDFLPKGSDPPSFQSGSRVYIAENSQSAAASMPATSVSNGTNLPNLAEVYYLYYDVCTDRGSAFNKTDPSRWTAFQGQFQFCIQRQQATTSASQFSNTDLVASTTGLDWYKTTKYDEPAFCTRVESEDDDFCVAESVMEGLSMQIKSIFNVTASFSDSDRSDISYSTEWGPHLTRAVFGGDSNTEPACPVAQAGNGWQNPNPYELIGEYGFGTTLSGIADGLSDAFRYDTRLSQDVFGTYTYRMNVLLVDFRWFILPAVLYGIVAVFFAVTMVMTRNTPMWKSSPLPLLHAMKEEGSLASEHRVRTEAKQSLMRLRRVETGWHLDARIEAPKSAGV